MGNVADISALLKRPRATFKIESSMAYIDRARRKEVFRIETNSRDYSEVSSWCIANTGQYGWSLTSKAGTIDHFVIIVYNNAIGNLDELKLIATLRWA